MISSHLGLFKLQYPFKILQLILKNYLHRTYYSSQRIFQTQQIN
jgi:hypothetical protein